MRLLLLVFSLFPFIHCSCPPEFDLVKDGQCRGKYAQLNTYDDEATDLAISKCSEIQGLPVIIHTDEQQSYWVDRIKHTGHTFILMGLVCNINTKRWEWADGSDVDYKPPSGHYMQELDQPCTTGCMWITYDPNLVTEAWELYCTHSEDYLIAIFCTTQLLPPVPSSDGCESFEDDSEDGFCYQIGAKAENWLDAQVICRNVGANLASIHNVKENNFVRRLAVSKGEVNSLFLGATRAGEEGAFEWIDGSAWDYQNFYSGFPMAGLGNCVAMDTQGTGGKWVNTDCSSKLSVACERSENLTPPTCPPGPWKEGEIIFSPGFPYSSSIPCDFMLTVEAGKKVDLEVILLEANSCCDHLVLFDNYIAGNVIANLTGEISNVTYTSTTNFMRATWQPNGGVNVRGVMMTYRAVY